MKCVCLGSQRKEKSLENRRSQFKQKMLHEELNLKFKNLRNLKYLKKLKVKTYEIMKLKNFKKLKKRSEMLENYFCQ